MAEPFGAAKEPIESDTPALEPSGVGTDDYGLSTIDPSSARADGNSGHAFSSIDRYQIISTLGLGGFGIVYKAYDPVLNCHVAVKVPHEYLFRTESVGEAYLAEARNMAALDHPGILPIFNAGRTSDGVCYFVSKFVPGGCLAKRIESGRLTHAESARLVADAADALHHAHSRGLVHRDIKPANLLLDEQGRPLIADFGLALKEADFGTGPSFSGTVLYMSPEQARREGHLVDPRTDVYSLGVVLFELVTGKPPHRSSSQSALLKEIALAEPRPPRQLDDSIPEELDRICLKAMARRPADRYSTAKDLANDLWKWLELQSATAHSSAAQHSPVVGSRGRAMLTGSLALPGCAISVSVALTCVIITSIVMIESPRTSQVQSIARLEPTSAPPLEPKMPDAQMSAPPPESNMPNAQALDYGSAVWKSIKATFEPKVPDGKPGLDDRNPVAPFATVSVLSRIRPGRCLDITARPWGMSPLQTVSSNLGCQWELEPVGDGIYAFNNLEASKEADKVSDSDFPRYLGVNEDEFGKAILAKYSKVGGCDWRPVLLDNGCYKLVNRYWTEKNGKEIVLDIHGSNRIPIVAVYTPDAGCDWKLDRR